MHLAIVSNFPTILYIGCKVAYYFIFFKSENLPITFRFHLSRRGSFGLWNKKYFSFTDTFMNFYEF